MGGALAHHDACLLGAIESHGGVVFSTGGDGVVAAFSRALDALDAARTAQQALVAETWPAPIELRVRMAVHTGEAEERDGDYFGPPLNRTARLMALSAGGEVLVSSATVELVGSRLGEGVSLVDLGEWELRSLARPERVHQLVWPGVVPRLPAAHGPRVGNLPGLHRRLVGRDQEVAAIVALLDEAPLVTLTGVGGVGKTSLGLAAAQLLAPSQPDGVWFCELADVSDGGEVPQSVAETMGLRPHAGLPPLELVVRALTHQRCLLVLDNCEHVLDAVSELAQAIVGRCPHAKVLATSREALGVPGERIMAVRTLPANAASELFRLRAEERDGGFAVDDDALIADLCDQLDGLPLAIELAAARAVTMPMTDLVGRLGERFRLLRGQRRATGRHQTLGATVAWSYDLLTEDERLLFDRLSVFSGGFTLAAAEAVCADDLLEPVEVDDLVASLAEKSMVTPGPGGRYLLLETLRQYGEEQLAGTDEPQRLRQAHLQHYRDFVVAAHDGLQGRDELAWWRRLQADWANVRSAFTSAVQNDDVESAATIATHLIWAATWHDTGEPMIWIDTVGAMPRAVDSPQWASILGGQAWVAWVRTELDEAWDLGSAALDAEPDDAPNLDHLAEFALLSAAYFHGDNDTARVHLERGLERARAAGRTTVEATYVTSHAIFLNGEARHGEAAGWARRARALAEPTGNPNAVAWAMAQEATAARGLGDTRRAAGLVEEAMAIALEAECVLPLMLCNRELAQLHQGAGRTGPAASVVVSSLQSMRRKSAWMFAHQSVVGAVMVLVHAGRWDSAGILYGATADSAIAGSSTFGHHLEQLRIQLAGALGEERLAELAESGRALSTEQAVLRAEAELNALIASLPRDAAQA
jgi:predicted ATPase